MRLFDSNKDEGGGGGGEDDDNVSDWLKGLSRKMRKEKFEDESKAPPVNREMLKRVFLRQCDTPTEAHLYITYICRFQSWHDALVEITIEIAQERARQDAADQMKDHDKKD